MEHTFQASTPAPSHPTSNVSFFRLLRAKHILVLVARSRRLGLWCWHRHSQRRNFHLEVDGVDRLPSVLLVGMRVVSLHEHGDVTDGLSDGGTGDIGRVRQGAERMAKVVRTDVAEPRPRR